MGNQSHGVDDFDWFGNKHINWIWQILQIINKSSINEPGWWFGT
jgi:hypothetical protein